MKQFDLILADPPWHYKRWGGRSPTGGGLARDHYSIINTDDLMQLPINCLAKKDSILLLWATYPLLIEALDVMKSWGFEYKTVLFTWVKTTENNKWHYGMGFYTRANPEILLLGTRGHGLKRVSKCVTNLTIAQRLQHSRKPGIIRKKIVELFGEVSRIELFASEFFKDDDFIDGWEVSGLLHNNETIRELLIRMNRV